MFYEDLFDLSSVIDSFRLVRKSRNNSILDLRPKVTQTKHKVIP
jgi:hypothetical protein